MNRPELIELLLAEAEDYRQKAEDLKFVAHQVETADNDEQAKFYIRKHLERLVRGFPALEKSLTDSANDETRKTP